MSIKLFEGYKISDLRAHITNAYATSVHSNIRPCYQLLIRLWNGVSIVVRYALINKPN